MTMKNVGLRKMQERSWTDRIMDDEHGYFLLQNGHVDYRKDNEKILWNCWIVDSNPALVLCL